MLRMKGFTLIELMAALAIMGALFIAMMPLLKQLDERKRAAFAISQAERLAVALNHYYTDFCGQVTFPQPALSNLPSGGYLQQAFVMPANVNSVSLAINNPNTTRAHYDIRFSFIDERYAQRVFRMEKKPSVSMATPTEVQWRGLVDRTNHSAALLATLEREIFEDPPCT